MSSLLSRYTHWLHTRWPAGGVEPLPVCDGAGRTNVAGVFIVGDLTGIPLLKFASKSGADAVRTIAAELGAKGASQDADGLLDLLIIGAGVSGVSAAIEARRAGLNFAVLESTTAFSTIANFPKRKPIYTFPTEMQVDGGLQCRASVKEELWDELETQRSEARIEVTPAHVERIERMDGVLRVHYDGTSTRTRFALVAIGRSGSFRRLGVPGEELDKVANRLHDPAEFCGKRVLVVGGGDTAIETTVALATSGAAVTLSYRGAEFTRPKPENIARLEALRTGTERPVAVEQPTEQTVTPASTAALQQPAARRPVHVLLNSKVQRIQADAVTLEGPNGTIHLPNDAVFVMLGREAPLDFFRRSGIRIRGEWTPRVWAAFAAFMAFCWFLYLWKSGTWVRAAFERNGWFPFNVAGALAGISANFAAQVADVRTMLGTLSISLGDPSFYYTLVYCLCMVVFGIRRIRRRRTPYVTAQTVTLIVIQCVPLFVLPFFLLPWAGHNGWFDTGFGRGFADALFPIANYGHGREYWRAFGLILAWPLFIWNVFTEQPLWWWLGISLVQTFVIIPLIVFRWGKGAYCGWICSCGGLAETMGDAHREKMPHGPFWNRLNMLGQAILAFAFLLLLLRVVGWIANGVPALSFLGFANWAHYFLRSGVSLFGVPLDYVRVVDLFLAGIIGVGFYFWFSGRVWCRFACPLAALMHIYARFSRYRIFPDKKKCISCNVCTSVCHQGIDVMNFANKGLPMDDPQCVRCSACVQQCPTGVLAFGRFGQDGVPILDRLPAMQEKA